MDCVRADEGSAFSWPGDHEENCETPHCWGMDPQTADNKVLALEGDVASGTRRQAKVEESFFSSQVFV